LRIAVSGAAGAGCCADACGIGFVLRLQSLRPINNRESRWAQGTPIDSTLPAIFPQWAAKDKRGLGVRLHFIFVAVVGFETASELA